ncbi:unnamed protein product [Cuscuta epithymum]|uniref:Uncharacterized protein n=1 Tax=Cuscuta epithymum TaxID=186058 RepID=A0AAV0CJK7_9ASTE|nr:unnamed protein product [Cuscuta epithymum]CAH9141433.1 unnamed protein product [Cuscuta epithymum]
MTHYYPINIYLALLITIAAVHMIIPENVYVNGDRICYVDPKQKNLPCEGDGLGEICIPTCIKQFGPGSSGTCSWDTPDKHCRCYFVAPKCP